MNSTRSSIAPSEHDPGLETPTAVAKKIAAVAWGLFFIWVGIGLLAQVGSGVGLLGVGVITLGAQVARAYFRLGVEPFWLVFAIACIVFGGWDLLQRELGAAAIPGSPVPILFIAVGVVVLVAALLRRPPH